ncbi:MAG: 16S rRNA (cytidine(1402)-2'-O)-methyltransferase [Pseudomonadota bacterium]
MVETNQVNPIGLYIVSTPIGNLSDISLRAIDILKIVDLIACEDTRVSGGLLAHYGINKPLISYNDHNGDERRPEILAEIARGRRVALISDAGTPLVSDPGYKLVREALAKDIYVTAIPGASSVLAALCLSGLPSDSFFFGGFLPSKSEALRKYITNLVPVPATLIFFESARRLEESLAVLRDVLKDRQAAIVREITKLYEESRRGKLSELLDNIEKNGAPKGEVVIVIAPPQNVEIIEKQQVEEHLEMLLKSHSVKEAATIIAEQTGQSRKEIYASALKILEKTQHKRGE